MNRLRETKLYIYHQHSVYRTICKYMLLPAVFLNEHLGSDTQRPHRAFSTNERTEWIWLFHIFSQFQDSLHYILLDVLQQKFLAVFIVCVQRGQRKKHQVTLCFNKWIPNRMPWEMRQLGHDRRTMSQSDSAWTMLLKSETKSDSDHTDCYVASYSKNKTWS